MGLIIPKGWRLMRPGEITTTEDFCFQIPHDYGEMTENEYGSTDIDDWERVDGIVGRVIHGGGIEEEGDYCCIRNGESVPEAKAEKEWLNPWD